ncbi:MAG TPA: hypothetical protein VJN69_11550 [Candidatus Acidoferrales bacterium]|nr:hypothetical protein [Candidatus Acidoferrales bacterium]
MSSTDVKIPSWIPRTEADLLAIRQQLARVLESTPFKTSKRYPALLSYVVEKTLQGDTECLKERTLGIEVFRREPEYDTNADPVVRIAAGEVRKRLAQYYYGPRHTNEIHIELPAGSYIPEFYAASDARLNIADGSGRSREIVRDMDRTIAAPFSQEEEHSGKGSSRWHRVLIPAFCLILGVVAGVIGTRVRTAVSSAPLTALDEFWRPLIGTPGTVWLCVGEAYVTGVELNPNGARNRFAANYRLSSGEQRAYPALNLADSTVLARVAGLLQTRDKGYSVHGESETTFSDLTNGPAVLIGSFNNDWTIRLSDQLRFHFEMDRDAGEQWIVDRQKPAEKIGTHRVGIAGPDTTDAYAIISRVHDPSTGQMVVALAGISTNGTTAAGRFVSEPRFLAEFAKSAPHSWQNENLQIVIAAPIVDGSLGPPHVVSSYVW